MADSNTPNFDFVKPEVGASEDTWGDKTNTNWDKADTAIFGRLAAAANLLDLVDKAASRLNLGFTGAAPGLAMLNSLGVSTALPITDWNNAHTLGNGPLYANNAALNPPVAGTAFVGVYVGSAATFGAVLAMPLSGADMPIWVRRYSAGAWGAWGQLSLKTQTQPLDATLTALAGLVGAADRLPYFNGVDTAALTVLTAAGRAILDDIDDAAQRATLGLGTAATTNVTTSNTDTTAGRLTKVGDFGLGSIGVPVSDYDAAMAYNAFVFNDSGTVNRPAFANNLAGFNLWRSTTIQGQLLMAMNASASQNAILTVRAKTAVDAWSPWYNIFGQNNVLGTVSQSAGVVTGRLIERGSNANGEFTKWADGTMECWSKRSAVDASSPAGAIFQHANLLSWTYPAAFIAAPMVTGAGGGTSRWCGISDPLLSSVPFRVLSSFSDATLLAPSLRAVGRWF